MNCSCSSNENELSGLFILALSSSYLIFLCNSLISLSFLKDTGVSSLITAGDEFFNF